MSFKGKRLSVKSVAHVDATVNDQLATSILDVVPGSVGIRGYRFVVSLDKNANLSRVSDRATSNIEFTMSNFY